MKRKQLLINLISNIVSFLLQLGISFILTPIITEKVGTAAYGFIGLSNNFVSYANIFAVIINSMAGRFITYELTRGKIEKANKYYSSIFFVDIVISLFTALISAIFIINLNYILNIPQELEIDVKITFILAFINFIISIISTVFTVATYAKNRLDMEAVRNIIGNIIKAIFLILIFSILTPKIYYILIGGLIFTIFVMIANIKITKKIAPELTISLKKYDKRCVKTLMKSGIWNSINSLSKILLTGLDLLIANIFIGPEAMGLLSIAKTIPSSIESLLATMATIFSPQFVILYSKHKIRDLIKEVNFSTKVIALVMIVPIAGFIAFGTEFFKLWLPTKNENQILEIQILSILSLLPYVISINNYTLFVLDTTTNKLKRPVVATTLMSLASAITTILLLKTTNLGVYAVAAVSSVYWCVKVIFFNTINAAKNLRVKRTIFFKEFIKNIVCFVIILIIYFYISNFISMTTWKDFIMAIIPLAIIGYLLTFMILLNKEEKKRIINRFKEKLYERKNK